MAPQHKKNNFHPLHRWHRKKYFSKDDAHHLINAVKTNYKVTIDLNGSLHINIKLDTYYTATTAYVDLNMKCFVDRAKTKFDNPIPKKPQHAPHPWTIPIYCQKLPSDLQSPTPHLSLTKKEREPSNPTLLPSSITQKSTRASKLHPTKFHLSNKNQHKKKKMQHYDG